MKNTNSFKQNGQPSFLYNKDTTELCFVSQYNKIDLQLQKQWNHYCTKYSAYDWKIFLLVYVKEWPDCSRGYHWSEWLRMVLFSRNLGAFLKWEKW